MEASKQAWICHYLYISDGDFVLNMLHQLISSHGLWRWHIYNEMKAFVAFVERSFNLIHTTIKVVKVVTLDCSLVKRMRINKGNAKIEVPVSASIQKNWILVKMAWVQVHTWILCNHYDLTWLDLKRAFASPNQG